MNLFFKIVLATLVCLAAWILKSSMTLLTFVTTKPANRTRRIEDINYHYARMIRGAKKLIKK